MEDRGMSQKSSGDRALDLIIDGSDISQYVGPWATCSETRVEWTVHTELICNDVTSDILQPLKDRNVRIEYRLRTEAVAGPWRSGLGVVTWRRVELGNEELILHGMGRLDKVKSKTKTTDTPVTARVAITTSIGGKVIQREEETGTITFLEEDPQQKVLREAQLSLAAETEVRAFTSPEFVLFLANSALSSYRLLHGVGVSHESGEFLYSSLIFLPLATEYFLKYLLFKNTGTFRKEYENHKLLALFDFLPSGLQKSVDEEFKDELENIGRERTFQDLRVFLRKSQNAFTAIRYLFAPQNAKTSRHLLQPENIAVLECVSNALERVSKRI